jgi:hypothetical protein
VGMPSVEEVRYVVTAHVLTLLDEAAEDTVGLKLVAHDWFPDADEFDRRKIAEWLKIGVEGMAGLIEKRRQGMIESGRTADLSGRQHG